MPTLVLMRHAQAQPHRGDDFSRALTERGRQDAAAARQWLQERQTHPDLAIVSTAIRARETWILADPGAGQVRHDDRIYEATTDVLRAVLLGTAEQQQTVLLLGHNPSIEALAWDLDEDLDARDTTSRGMSTCSLAVFELTGWDLRTCRLTDWVTPRG